MISDNSKADETYNIDQFIDMKSSDTNTYYNYSIKEYLNGFEYSISNILYDYMDELIDQSKILKLDDTSFAKYKYKPWLLAYDIYGSEQSVFIIFALNNIICDREFDFKRVRVLMPADVNTLLGRILSANEKFINTNKSDIALLEKKDTGNTVW